ncbi:hypothetical protein JL720_12706 [Aureococcus anophagefferens]|nr:hypothetical protein JL720_12706 [Aureococcus anophagefferens]
MSTGPMHVHLAAAVARAELGRDALARDLVEGTRSLIFVVSRWKSFSSPGLSFAEGAMASRRADPPRVPSPRGWGKAGTAPVGPAPPVQSETWETTESPLLRSLPPSPAQPACPPSQAETWDPTEPQRRSSSQYSRASASNVEPELRDSLRDSARWRRDAPGARRLRRGPNAAEEPTQAHTYGRVPPDDAPAPMEPAKKDSPGAAGADAWYAVKHLAPAVAALVWLLNLYVYYGDPATYSNGESYGTMIGDIYHGWLLSPPADRWKLVLFGHDDGHDEDREPLADQDGALFLVFVITCLTYFFGLV